MKNLNKFFLFALMVPCLVSCSSCSTTTEYGDWVKTNAFGGSTRSGSASFVIGNDGYIFGGYTGKERLKDLWVLNTDNNDTWTQLQSLRDTLTKEVGVPRMYGTGFAIDGKGYIGLGFDGTNYLKDFWQYDPEINAWHRKADFMGSARDGAVGFALNGKGYVGTGVNDYQLNDFYSYDPVSDTWSQSVTIPGDKRYNSGVFVYNNEAYVVGGVYNGAPVTYFSKFNPTTQKWTELNRLSNYTDQGFDDKYDNLAREYPCIFVIGDKAYMTCGQRSSTLLSDTWEYDIATDRWKLTSAFEGTPRIEAVTFSVNGRGLLVTGRSSSYRFDDTWEFLPDQEYDPTRN